MFPSFELSYFSKYMPAQMKTVDENARDARKSAPFFVPFTSSPDSKWVVLNSDVN